jgi:segregation and condensation protein A
MTAGASPDADPTPTEGVIPAAAEAGGSLPDGSVYSVKLSIFEGPLDLLLHLIRINEVEVTDIPVARIARQYLDYLEMMRELNLDVAGEYLVMSATLAWIKSRMLLPPDPSAIEGEDVDPRAELVARLLEYQRFKEAAGSLGERPLLGRDVFASVPPDLEPVPEAEREIEVGVYQLVEAFRQALKRAGPSGAAHEVEAETVTVRERMLSVMEQLKARDACEFLELVTEEGHVQSRPIVVATFLAILELTRLEALGLYQGVDTFEVPEGPIHVRRKIDPGDAGWVERISELM